VWKTDQYRQQFPSFSPGIGLLVGFGHSLRLSSVTVTSPSPGTVVQIRSAASPGVSLDSSTVLATATLHSGATAIPLPAHPTSPYLLVWITKLSSTGGGFQSEIGGIMVQPMP
jgi:putative peptidoglycan lipid II flippase